MEVVSWLIYGGFLAFARANARAVHALCAERGWSAGHTFSILNRGRRTTKIKNFVLVLVVVALDLLAVKKTGEHDDENETLNRYPHPEFPL